MEPFNRLTQVKKRVSPNPVVANYTYNALGQRISEQYDCNDSGNTGATDGVTDSYDPVFFIANDRQGRRVATFRGSDTNPKETFIYHDNGSSQGYGPGLPGGVMLRDRDAICATPEKWATTAANSTRAERYFYFPDSKGSIMALVSASGTLAEQYRYSPTGLPFGIPGGDLNANGFVKGNVTGEDYNIVNTSGYEVRKDLDLDGDVDSADTSIVSSANGRESGRGVLSTSPFANRAGSLGEDQVSWSLSSDSIEAGNSIASESALLQAQPDTCLNVCANLARWPFAFAACMQGCDAGRWWRQNRNNPRFDLPILRAFCRSQCAGQCPDPPYEIQNLICTDACMRGKPIPPIGDPQNPKPWPSSPLSICEAGCEENGQANEPGCYRLPPAEQGPCLDDVRNKVRSCKTSCNQV